MNLKTLVRSATLLVTLVFSALNASTQSSLGYSCISYKQKGNTTIGNIVLTDNSIWVCEVPILNDFRLDQWEEGDLVSVYTNASKVMTAQGQRWKSSAGFLLKNFNVDSQVVVYPHPVFISASPKIVQIRVDSGWFLSDYYLQLEDGAWWKVDVYSDWEEGHRIWIDKSNVPSSCVAINLDMTFQESRIDTRMRFLIPVDSCPETARRK